MGEAMEIAALGSNDEEKGKAKIQLKWLQDYEKEMSALASAEIIGGMDFLRIMKKLERRCVREIKRLKTAKKARKMLNAVTKLLRALKMVSLEVDENESKIKASFSLILTHTISIVLKLREPESEARALYEFFKGILDLDPVWIFTTLLAVSQLDSSVGTNPLQSRLLALAMNDPVLVSSKEIVVQKALCATSLLLKLEGNKGKNLRTLDDWNKDGNFLARGRNIDVHKVIQACQRKLKIRIPKTELRTPTEFGTSSVGIGWSLSTAPAELPDDFSEVEENDHEDLAVSGDDDENFVSQTSEDVIIPESRIPSKRSRFSYDVPDDSD